MNSDTQFPGTIPPFRYPVPPPTPEPDDAPLVQVCVNFEWMAYILGALKSLMLQATWATDDPDVRELALQRAEFLIGMFMQASNGCGINVPTVLCISGSFVDDAYGFVPALAADCSPDYVHGTGWQSCFAGSIPADVMELERFFNSSTFIRSFALAINNSNALLPYVATITFFNAGVQTFQYIATVVTVDVTIQQDVNAQADTWLIDLRSGNLAHEQTMTLENWELCYTGDFPMSQPSGWTMDFPFGNGQQGWDTFTVGGVTYAVWTGTSWTAGCLQCNGGAFDQLQIKRAFTPHGTYSIAVVEITYSCALDVRFQTATSAFVDGPSGTNQVVTFIPENPTNDPGFGADVLRIIATNQPPTNHADITITRIRLTGTGVKPS